MDGCKTCGSIGASYPHRDEYPESVKCQCGFRESTEVCGRCYTKFPYTEDENGIDVKCPKCNKFVAFFNRKQLQR